MNGEIFFEIASLTVDLVISLHRLFGDMFENPMRSSIASIIWNHIIPGTRWSRTAVVRNAFANYLLDRTLSKPGNPNLMISATRLKPFWGSAGTKSALGEGTNGTAGSVIAGDKTAAVAAETVPKIGKPGGANLFDLVWACLWYAIPPKKLAPLAKISFNLDMACKMCKTADVCLCFVKSKQSITKKWDLPGNERASVISSDFWLLDQLELLLRTLVSVSSAFRR